MQKVSHTQGMTTIQEYWQHRLDLVGLIKQQETRGHKVSWVQWGGSVRCWVRGVDIIIIHCIKFSNNQKMHKKEKLEGTRFKIYKNFKKIARR